MTAWLIDSMSGWSGEALGPDLIVVCVLEMQRFTK